MGIRKHAVSGALMTAFLVAAAPAYAVVTPTVVAGTTTGGPTYNRTLAGNPPTTKSAVGTNVNYSVVQFGVGSQGTYTLTQITTYDSFLSLYSGSFDAANPLTNILEASDDGAGTNLGGLISRNLVSGTNYFAVLSSFSNGVSGQYSLSISGPGAVTIGAVPEPAMWAMMLVGFGMISGAARYRRRSVKVSLA
jgi:hypothetical protein